MKPWSPEYEAEVLPIRKRCLPSAAMKQPWNFS
jgi:hypothetical protein